MSRASVSHSKLIENVVALRWKGVSGARKLPRIGLGMASEGAKRTEREIQRLRALHLSHVRVDIRLADNRSADDNYWLYALRRAHAEVVERLGAKMECALHLVGKDEAANRADLMNLWYHQLYNYKQDVARVLVFHQSEKSTSARWLELTREIFSRTGRLCFPIFGGTDAYFAELNRERPPANALDGVCWSLNPQVHAFDDASLVENLEGQAWTVRSARALYGKKKLAVSPVTLKPRFNPNATAQAQTTANELPPSVDARQMSLFGAGWTLGSLKALCESGVDSITVYETVGWRGVMEREQGSPLPDKFPSLPGAVFPLYHVLADVGEFANGRVVPGISSAPDCVEVLTLLSGARIRLLCANLTDQTQTVHLSLPTSIGSAQFRLLDSNNAPQAMQSPESFRGEPESIIAASKGVLEFALPADAYARLDFSKE